MAVVDGLYTKKILKNEVNTQKGVEVAFGKVA